MGIIEAAKLVFEYKKYDENGQVEEVKKAVDGVDLNIQKGQFIAILGHNGSGKSTLAKHINAILVPTEGTLYVDGKDTRKEENVWDIRSSAGMVFQNPDNQIIGSVVEEDVGFGPENMGGQKRACAAAACGSTARHRPTSCQAARNSGWPLQGWWPCIQNALCWMSQPPC